MSALAQPMRWGPACLRFVPSMKVAARRQANEYQTRSLRTESPRFGYGLPAAALRSAHNVGEDFAGEGPGAMKVSVVAVAGVLGASALVGVTVAGCHSGSTSSPASSGSAASSHRQQQLGVQFGAGPASRLHRTADQGHRYQCTRSLHGEPANPESRMARPVWRRRSATPTAHT